ncbi:hypothetical protein [Saccharopolyspora shandongensis]|uniref:hypothetical protein n=1 Tax=Saccharopolyspora shandongensis TaxID=418495 RepID=UPI0033F2A775
MTVTYARAAEEQFTASTFHTAKDKMLTVNATARFLSSGMDPEKFSKRAYHFFHQTLSMPAEYDMRGFAATHFSSDRAKADFLDEVRHEVRIYAGLDPERCSDMAALFSADHDGPYADLLDQY